MSSDEEKELTDAKTVVRRSPFHNQNKPFNTSMVMDVGSMASALFGVSDQEIEKSLEIQDQSQKRLGEILVDEDVLTERQVQVCLEVLRKRERTFLSHAFLMPLRTSWWGRSLQLWAESFVAVLLTFYVTYGVLGLAEAALVTLFLASAVLTTRFQRLIDKNELQRQATAILVMFIGLLSAFYVSALWLDAQTTSYTFGFFMQFGQVGGSQTMSTRQLGDFLPLLQHNVLVLCSVFVISFVYRAFGAVLMLGWNAAIWGMVYAILTKQSIAVVDLDAMIQFLGWGLALLPHLVLEGAAYVVCALGAIQVSRSILWSARNTGNFVVVRKGAAFAAVAIALVAVGAAFEAYWVPLVMGFAGG